MQPSEVTDAKNAPKLAALRHNPAVALTIDTEVHPPRILLIRGRAELDVDVGEVDRLRDDPPERGSGVARQRDERQRA